MGSFFSKSKRLVILRGLPGSGKTTLAHELSAGVGKVFSTDDYFVEDGYYIFKNGKCKEAHLWNQQRTEEAMKSGTPYLIIDNTNARRWEAKPYVELGVKYGYEIEFLEPKTDWSFDVDTLVEKSVHSVPKRHIERMKKVWETDFTIDDVLSSSAPWE